MQIDFAILSPYLQTHLHTWKNSLGNHLWQSTIFVILVWLLTLALRKNYARFRYWLWLAASIKFLVPFAPLISLGRGINISNTPQIAHRVISNPAISSAVEQITLPFPQTDVVSNTPALAHHTNLILVGLISAWACGALLLLFSWTRTWWRLRCVVREAYLHAEIDGARVFFSSSLIEPGVFGIVRPVLLLPAGIQDRLDRAQMQAVIAHEMCHVRRRDNLTFALHMVVEILFWFHPAVWWIRTRLIEEREWACDEAVLQSGNEAEVYAEGILNVCKFYVESPLACAAGVTGSDLKQRIVRIMTQTVAQKLGPGRKLMLGVAAILVLCLPVVFGLMHALRVQAQTELANLPQFEVATVKPSHPSDDQQSLLLSPGRFTMENMPIKELIRFAYGLKSEDQLSGVPAWAASDRFDIVAKESESQTQILDKLPGEQRMEQVRLMAQSLLAERFGLRVSHESRELPVYVLVVAKNGSKLTPAAPPPAPPAENEKPGDPPRKTGMHGIRRSGPGELQGMSATIDLLVNVLSHQPDLGNRLVLDQTGLTGLYDWTLKWAPVNAEPGEPEASAGDPSEPALFTALQEQLGLKLESQKAPVDVVVIDRIEKPSPN
ncbi:TIGR03435 family protein [Acidicapsa dinghuensis]|uniref:TIGR03435 family protein n=1 Tax=Acidicapsa dinghuensis TaxID=2218256 RepID=A0ABW1EFV4_9BACT|nr:M56 and DUF3738 domain-containing protein [Acidicapsa dinghuensis]